MQCPVCKVTLTEREVAGAALQFCSNCGGLLCPRDTFRQYLAALQQSPLDELTTSELLGRKAVPPFLLPPEAKSCPGCGEAMASFNYAYDSNIILDRCSNCNLIWADRDEIIKVAQYVKSNPTVEKLGKALAGLEEESATFREMAEELPDMMASALRFGLLPISDEAKTSRFPLMTVLLILSNLVIFFLSQSAEALEQFAFIPTLFFRGRDLHRLVTSQFLHAGFLHLAGNMLFLWIFGDNVEDRFGRVPFLVAYMFFGAAADIAHAVTTAHPDVPCVGASGAISGVMGCYFILFPQARIRTAIGRWVVPVHACFYLAWWFLMQLLFSAFDSTVAYFAHIGGFLVGAIVALVYRFAGKTERVQPARAVPPGRGE
jgi:membrane associated rhomboid family serine protease/Zn-finger nucleic acid-binding protein